MIDQLGPFHRVLTSRRCARRTARSGESSHSCRAAYDAGASLLDTWGSAEVLDLRVAA